MSQDNVTSEAGIRRARRHADADMPLVADAWYLAGTSAGSSRAFRDRWILNRNVVCYRKEDGTPTGAELERLGRLRRENLRLESRSLRAATTPVRRRRDGQSLLHSFRRSTA